MRDVERRTRITEIDINEIKERRYINAHIDALISILLTSFVFSSFVIFILRISHYRRTRNDCDYVTTSVPSRSFGNEALSLYCHERQRG